MIFLGNQSIGCMQQQSIQIVHTRFKKNTYTRQDNIYCASGFDDQNQTKEEEEGREEKHCIRATEQSTSDTNAWKETQKQKRNNER